MNGEDVHTSDAAIAIYTADLLIRSACKYTKDQKANSKLKHRTAFKRSAMFITNITTAHVRTQNLTWNRLNLLQ